MGTRERSLAARTAAAARDIGRRSLGMTRDTVHKELLERAKAQEALTDDQIWRRYQLRHLAAFVTIPALLLGTASIATAYSAGLMTPDPKPVCRPVVVPAPAPASVKVTVMNASGQNGAGQAVGHDLGRRGFTVTAVSSAPRQLYVKAPAKIFHGKAGLDQALLLAQQITGAELENDGRAGTSVAFVLGADYTSLLAAPPPKPPSLKKFKVNVYNTTWRSGLAATTSKELARRGFTTGKSGNDPDGSYLPDDTVVVRHGPDGDLAAGLVARHFAGAVLTQVPREGLSVDVVLGSKYDDITPVADLVPLPVQPKEPPATVARPCS